ncbi:MAG: hypothetical protein M1818_002548 [Claussenomyces sp. TS43310]|nr:MAG: hypothetical protein M1818_002548 [Claussenomyces sp. TS43310]
MPPSFTPSSATKGGKGATGTRKFELPVLAPLGSLTAGTDIPPPPDSPVEESPAVSSHAEPRITEVSDSTNGHESGAGTPKPGETYDGRGRTNWHASPASPTSQKRPNSIRRFFSHKSLNHSYSNQSRESLAVGEARPESPGSFTIISGPPTRSKRSSSWFGRFTGSGLPESENKRASTVYEEKPSAKGPPPPRLPELNQLKAKVEKDKGFSLGAEDMFKNIH